MAHKAAQVYIIDDDAAREEVAALVRTLGLGVFPSESAEAFLRAYDGYRPACIIAGMQLPGMSGNDLLLELRSRGLTIPVIILMNRADTPATVLVMKNGAFTTLDKPCRSAELWDSVREALREDIRRSEEDRQRQEVRERLSLINPLERAILQRILAGDKNKQIAYRLDIGMKTVETRRKSLNRKMQIASMAELVKQVLLAEPELLPHDSTD